MCNPFLNSRAKENKMKKLNFYSYEDLKDLGLGSRLIIKRKVKRGDNKPLRNLNKKGKPKC